MYDVLHDLDGKFMEDGIRFDARHIDNIAKYAFLDVGDEFEDYLSDVVDRTLPVGYTFSHCRTGDVVILVVKKLGE